MAYCKNCGAPLAEGASTCPRCQASQGGWPLVDRGGFLWGLLGFVSPELGLVAYLLQRDARPKNAGAAGTGAIAGLLFSLLLALLAQLR